ncbi:hypothetical protein MSAN_00207300 [Mycena sanguinolenta]|uniref:DUF6534 domain-containing protein n=1 Tax=Mycena sanguinolenta TaxID=230812 RepID=A0A8H6ZF29_9AGAR|nr:hypothetical protein MSAN_00207300 [Mycena sanguinolenta]
MDNVVPAMDNSLGALEIGVLVSYLLFGVTTTQTYIYYNRFPDDSPKLKAMVAFIWVCECGHAICIGQGLYNYTITNYGQPESLASLPKSILTSTFLTAVITSIVHGFFAFRIYSLTKKLYICFIISILMFLRLLATTALSFVAMSEALLVPFENRFEWLVISTLTISATIDSTIAVILVVSLRNQSRDVAKRTTALVDKLIAWTIETAGITSVSSIITFLCFVTMTHNFIWLGVQVVSARGEHVQSPHQGYSDLSAVFSNSLLASLNSRVTLREMDKLTVTLQSLPPTIPQSYTGVNLQATKTSEAMNNTEA